MSATYVETDCTIEHDGHTFECGGALVAERLIIGYVGDSGVITDWHGTRTLLTITRTRRPLKKAWMHGPLQNLTHVWAMDAAGRRWYGKYGQDWSQLIRMRPLKSA